MSQRPGRALPRSRGTSFSHNLCSQPAMSAQNLSSRLDFPSAFAYVEVQTFAEPLMNVQSLQMTEVTAVTVTQFLPSCHLDRLQHRVLSAPLQGTRAGAGALTTAPQLSWATED